MSREIVNEITDDPENSSITSSGKIKESQRAHLNDTARREEYEAEWKKLKRHSVKLPRVSFSKFFEEKGHLGAK